MPQRVELARVVGRRRVAQSRGGGAHEASRQGECASDDKVEDGVSGELEGHPGGGQQENMK